jgi:hypothetical protein
MLGAMVAGALLPANLPSFQRQSAAAVWAQNAALNFDVCDRYVSRPLQEVVPLRVVYAGCDNWAAGCSDLPASPKLDPVPIVCEPIVSFRLSQSGVTLDKAVLGLQERLTQYRLYGLLGGMVSGLLVAGVLALLSTRRRGQACL